MVKDPKIYAIIRVNIKTFTNLDKEINASKFKGIIKPIVPSASLLNKTYRGANKYTIVPMLFNYGFLKFKRSLLYQRDFINEVPKILNSVHSWVKSNDSLHPKRKARRVDSLEFFDDFSIVATVSRQEVKDLIKISKSNLIYNKSDLYHIQPGDIITLKGYPYDGLMAEVITMDFEIERVRVSLVDSIVDLNLDLGFESIFYTVYRDSDPDKLLSDGCPEFIENINYEQ